VVRIAICGEPGLPLRDAVTRTVCELVTTLADSRAGFQFVSVVELDQRLA
jgi:hypothetical protein